MKGNFYHTHTHTQENSILVKVMRFLSKKENHLRLLSFFVLLINLFILVVSCQKSIVSNKYDTDIDNIENWPIEKQVDYANKHLIKGAIIYEKYKDNLNVAKKISGLLEKKQQAGLEPTLRFEELYHILLEEKNNSKIDVDDIQALEEEINMFHNLIQGEDLVPQLFFYNYNQTQTYYHRNTTNDTEYIFATDPNESSEVPSYKIENDTYVPTGDTLNEQTAQSRQNLVVIGFDEDIEDGSTIPPNDSITSPPQTIQLTDGNVDAYLHKLAISKHKEVWYKGKSEVHFAGVALVFENMRNSTLNYNGGYSEIEVINAELNYLNSTSEAACYYSQPMGHEFAVIKRRDVENRTLIIKDHLIKDVLTSVSGAPTSVNFVPRYLNRGGFGNAYFEGVQLWIFEYDSWPVGLKKVKIYKPFVKLYTNRSDNDAIITEREFRSYHTPYANVVIFNAPYTHNIGNGMHIPWPSFYYYYRDGIENLGFKTVWDPRVTY